MTASRPYGGRTDAYRFALPAARLDLLAVLEQICATSSFQQIGDLILPALADQVKARSAAFRHVQNMDASNIQLLRSASYGMPPGDMWRLQQNYIRLDPLARLSAAGGRKMAVFRPREIIDHRRFDQDELFCRVMAEAGVHHVVCIFIETEPGRPFLFGLHRPASSSPFLDRDLGILSHCLTPLASTLARLRLSEKLEELQGRQRMSPDETGFPALVLDDVLQPIYIEAHGRALVTDLATGGRFRTRLEAAVAQLCRADGTDRGVILPVGSGAVEVQRAEHNGANRFIVYQRIEGVQSSGLTAREHEIVTDICRGLANKEIARHRQISINTVQNHLRAIFAKTGVDSRTRLMCLALGESALPIA